MLFIIKNCAKFILRDFAEQGCIRCIPSNLESNFFTTLKELNRLGIYIF